MVRWGVQGQGVGYRIGPRIVGRIRAGSEHAEPLAGRVAPTSGAASITDADTIA